MSGDQVARILGSEVALERGIGEITGLGHKTQRTTEQHQMPAGAVGDGQRNDTAKMPAALTPPSKPAHVLLGETRAHSLGPPISRPLK